MQQNNEGSLRAAYAKTLKLAYKALLSGGTNKGCQGMDAQSGCLVLVHARPQRHSQWGE